MKSRLQDRFLGVRLLIFLKWPMRFAHFLVVWIQTCDLVLGNIQKEVPEIACPSVKVSDIFECVFD